MNTKKLKKDRLPSLSEINAFRKEIYDYFHKQGRDLPWRKTRNPYHILVSEIMLQQTQVDRVIEKYREFIKAFPDFASLRRASLARILKAWQGLGYNRRALALKKIAATVMLEYHGRLPSSVDALSSLPGIGHATASSICAFGFNMPTVFIETNIRAVFIHHFFRSRRIIGDAEFVDLIEKALDRKNPRKWYSALMDYGAMLKKKYPHLSKKSAHYNRQSPFHGSKRQLRGMILRLLLKHPEMALTELTTELCRSDEPVIGNILGELTREGLVTRKRDRYAIA